MVWVNHSAVDATVRDTTNTLRVFSTVTAYEDIPAQIQYVDQSNHLLRKLGLRPDVDLIAHVPSDTTIQQGWTCEWNAVRYAVYKVEQADTDSAKRVVLKEQGSTSTSGVDLDT